MRTQSGAWIAGDSSVDVDTKWGDGKTFFSGKGLFLLRCTGSGDILVASYGAILDMNLEAGQSYTLDPGYVVAFDEECSTTCTRPGTGRPRSSVAKVS